MFSKRLTAILTTLGWLDLAKTNALTNEQWTKVEEEYNKAHDNSYKADLQAEVAKSQELQKTVVALLNGKPTEETPAPAAGSETPAPAAGSETPAPAVGSETPAPAPTPVAGAGADINVVNAALTAILSASRGQALPDKPLNTVTGMALKNLGGAHSSTHAFGIEHPIFDAKQRFNKITMRQIGLHSESATKADREAFESAVVDYGVSLAHRVSFLHAAGLLSAKAIADGIDYTSLTDAGLGDQYVVRRQDALIARIISLPSVDELFPRRSGIQDQDLITNVFFGEFSQSYQTGEVFKGGFKLEPDKARVSDVMFKHNFGPMKDIERMYIGYLNTNGSDPVKWNMIEWFILQIMTVLNNERNDRAIMGCRVEPIKDKPGHYLNGARGLVYLIQELSEANKIKLVDDEAFASYTSTTMLDVVEGFVSEIHEVNPELLRGKTLYLNENHKPWYKALYRAKYGKDMDFAGVQMKLANYDITIAWVPLLGALPLIILQDPGNIQQCEDVPGEMSKVQFEQRMENVLSWSVWKEGMNTAYSGRKFATKAELDANNYNLQAIFANKPCVKLAADATTINGLAGIHFVTADNTAAKAITAISNPRAGIVYKIECGGVVNATTIAKSGNFSEINAAFTPTAVGQWIKVILNPETSKFREVSRG